jgi:hypothetical protein
MPSPNVPQSRKIADLGAERQCHPPRSRILEQEGLSALHKIADLGGEWSSLLALMPDLDAAGAWEIR